MKVLENLHNNEVLDCWVASYSRRLDRAAAVLKGFNRS